MNEIKYFQPIFILSIVTVAQNTLYTSYNYGAFLVRSPHQNYKKE
jgi:hypothetical protein